MNEEEYKKLMSDCGFSVVEDDMGSSCLYLYYVACYGNSGNSGKWQNAFAIYDTDNGKVISYSKLYYEKSQGICVVKDKKIETKDINTLRPVIINLAEQYKKLLVIQKKEEIKKDFENE